MVIKLTSCYQFQSHYYTFTTDSEKLYPTLPSDKDQANSSTVADPSKGWQPFYLASGGGDQVTSGPVWSLAAAPGNSPAPAYLKHVEARKI
jgi:hypothetical protein